MLWILTTNRSARRRYRRFSVVELEAGVEYAKQARTNSLHEPVRTGL